MSDLEIDAMELARACAKMVHEIEAWLAVRDRILGAEPDDIRAAAETLLTGCCLHMALLGQAAGVTGADDPEAA